MLVLKVKLENVAEPLELTALKEIIYTEFGTKDVRL